MEGEGCATIHANYTCVERLEHQRTGPCELLQVLDEGSTYQGSIQVVISSIHVCEKALTLTTKFEFPRRYVPRVEVGVTDVDGQ